MFLREVLRKLTVRGGGPDGSQPGATKWRDAMKTLKRFLVALLALLPLATGMAVADTEDGYDRLFVFGASLIDPGNHFAVTGQTAHPPFEPVDASYGIGGHHFSNGRTWVELLAEQMELTKWAKPAYRNPVFGNYAVGYARARDMLPPEPDPMEPSLGDQVKYWDYNGYCTGNPDNRMYDTLFIVDSGYRDALDLMNAQSDEEKNAILQAWIGSIYASILELYKCGAHNLLVAYLPDMAVPMVPQAGKDGATAASMMFNYMLLQPTIAAFSEQPYNMNVSTVDFFFVSTLLKGSPEAFGFTNTTDACITPYVTEGAFCEDPDAYFWWDQLHPTKKVHALFAEFAYGQLPVPD
jgi:phospholipase/lecithinase/hemolysin